jgi:murein DD-endopeptidase MepM/ murein hydrolase activator NlpD
VALLLRRSALPAAAAALGVAASLGCAATAALANQNATVAPSSSAPAGSSGATQAPSAPRSGGSEYGVTAASAGVERPVVGLLSVPASAPAGPPPAVRLRIDEPGQTMVNVRVTVTSLATRRPVLVVGIGWIHTGRAVGVRWPTWARLAAGSYHVSLVARDARSVPLLRRAHASGVATLMIAGPAPAQPPPVPQKSVSSTPPGVLTPAQLAAEGAVFPVAGAHNFGGPENRFGAPRDGYTHQGQDILTSEGTPVLAPLAGTMITTGYQEARAGYYAAEHTSSGFDFFFAHCMAGSLSVATGQSVAAGQTLCRAGQTGDATAPHLHFEMWVGGWRTEAGYPVDPLPYLEAIERNGASG